jgi:hypothetical protein
VKRLAISFILLGEILIIVLPYLYHSNIFNYNFPSVNSVFKLNESQRQGQGKPRPLTNGACLKACDVFQSTRTIKSLFTTAVGHYNSKLLLFVKLSNCTRNFSHTSTGIEPTLSCLPGERLTPSRQIVAETSEPSSTNNWFPSKNLKL